MIPSQFSSHNFVCSITLIAGIMAEQEALINHIYHLE
jgi:hypothetical protein